MNLPTVEPRPKVRLSGEDGNSMMILGRCRRSLRQSKWTNGQIEAFSKEAMSSDYDHVLRTAMKYLDCS